MQEPLGVGNVSIRIRIYYCMSSLVYPFGGGPILALPPTVMVPAAPTAPPVMDGFRRGIEPDYLSRIAKNAAAWSIYVWRFPRSFIPSEPRGFASASMQFPLPPPAPPLMIALALPLTENGLLTQRPDKIGSCGRVTVTSIAVEWRSRLLCPPSPPHWPDHCPCQRRSHSWQRSLSLVS